MVDGYQKIFDEEHFCSRVVVDQKESQASRITIRGNTRNNAVFVERYWACFNQKEKRVTRGECTKPLASRTLQVVTRTVRMLQELEGTRFTKQFLKPQLFCYADPETINFGTPSLFTHIKMIVI